MCIFFFSFQIKFRSRFNESVFDVSTKKKYLDIAGVTDRDSLPMSRNFARRYWSTTGSGQQYVTDVPRDNKAAIINSIASSYALQRPRFTVTPVPRNTKVTDGKTRYSDGKSDWPYYQTYRQTAEAQKAQIFEDIQRKMANASSVANMGYSFVNATNLADQRQHRLRMKHHGLASKGKRIRTREYESCAFKSTDPNFRVAFALIHTRGDISTATLFVKFILHGDVKGIFSLLHRIEFIIELSGHF